MKRLKLYLQRVYRLSLSYKRQEALVWKDLKKHIHSLQWRYGAYEREKVIRVGFTFSNGQKATFYYGVNDRYLNYSVRIIEHFDANITSDLFILAMHFNNALQNGVVTVNVDDHYVEYQHKIKWLVPLLYSGTIGVVLSNHFKAASKVHAAFHRLITEEEAPAIIFADIMKELEDGDNNQSERQ